MAMKGTDFPPLHIIPPQPEHPHTNTAIMIHGRGSDGPEFAEEIFSATLSEREGDDLRSRFPGWRWIFPSSRSLWSSTFQEESSQWFDIYSLTDVDAKQDLQMEGIRGSTKYLLRLMDKEIERLRQAREKLFVCGISQGGAIGLWTILCQKSSLRNIGGFIGLSCWLPFAEVIKCCLQSVNDSSQKSSGSFDVVEAAKFVASMMADTKSILTKRDGAGSFLRTPVFLGHGIDDAYVDVTLGRKLRDVLELIGLAPVWREYTGAGQEGHWIKEPEELVDIAGFLAAQAEKSAVQNT
ncbi:hypothetical protein GJ744_002713 [Endocarpon pusillum]|uniref:Phospholipase/carboxylesterase/thioesterase domain-containing protein n=1 Tax=Endocarpon pusillum TaxID=364733 RepID=A0A8H7AVQ5_9EURO|nr:hypothetical protein GJ744_002713 [Endocarpon pusillum]